MFFIIYWIFNTTMTVFCSLLLTFKFFQKLNLKLTTKFPLEFPLLIHLAGCHKIMEKLDR